MTGFKLSCWWKELLKTENCKSWIVWKCKSTFFPLWSSKGLYVVCSLMLLNNIYWWRCAVFLNLPHKKKYNTTCVYPFPQIRLYDNPSRIPTTQFFTFQQCHDFADSSPPIFQKKTMCEVKFLSIFIEEKKFHFRCCWTGHVLIEGLWIFFTF